ncbi:MAG: MFS transporter [Gammaproteobacteria bacterium]|nr:MFS transporter [Gammaproteobacteria bacterium]
MQQTTPANKTHLFRGIFIISLASLFYIYEFILQASPAVITEQLIYDFNLNAANLSILVACFFYASTPTQLVGGILYDRFGPRLLMTIAISICALGTLCFATAYNIIPLAMGRAMMGLGSALSFVGILVLTARWLPNKYFALVVGLVQAFGSLGAMGGQAPLAAAIHTWGWRNSFIGLFILGVIIAILVASFVRNWPKHAEQTKRQLTEKQNHSIKDSLRAVFRNKQMWWIVSYAFTSWLPITVFAELWGIKYLSTLYTVSITEASGMNAMVWIGIAIGSPLFGWWSSKIGKRCIPLATSAALSLFASIIILYIPIPIWLMDNMLFILGMGTSGQALIFAVSVDRNSPIVVGTAIGFTNLCVVASGDIGQPLSGILLHINWQHTLSSAGTPIYNTSDNFQIALSIMPIVAAIGLIISIFFIKETYCKPQYS